jgi:hypothetical protein
MAYTSQYAQDQLSENGGGRNKKTPEEKAAAKQSRIAKRQSAKTRRKFDPSNKDSVTVYHRNIGEKGKSTTYKTKKP